MSDAPNRPCSSRKLTISARLLDMPHRAEATVKPAMEAISSCLRPIRPASQPVMGVPMVEATM